MKNFSQKYITDKEMFWEYINSDILVNFGESFNIWKRIKNDKFKLLFFLRLTHYYIYQPNKTPWKRLAQSISHSFFKYYQQKFCLDIKPKICIGKALHLPHPLGIVIHGKVSIGDFCTIMQQVTIGNKSQSNLDAVPVVLDHVYLGAGARILGKCTIGNHVKVGANAVVLNDVDDFAIATGVPAVVRKKEKFD